MELKKLISEKELYELTYDDMVRECLEIFLNGLVSGQTLKQNIGSIVMYTSRWVEERMEQRKKAA